MYVSPQAVLISRSQQSFQKSPAIRRDGAFRPIATDSSPSSDTIVHVVSNDRAQVSSLTHFFASHSIKANSFATANEYIRYGASDRIACVILDLDLPDISGLDVQTSLAHREGPPVVFVAARGDLNSGVRAMKNGAIDFMIEPLDYNRLLAAVETAFAQDRKARDQRVERSSLLRRWNSLTPREQDVFQFTVTGFLNKQAAGELGITENTFQVHRGRVMRKMKADSLAALVRMSTQLESLAQSLRKCETPIQSLKTMLKGIVQETARGTNTMREMRNFYANRVSPAAYDGSLGLHYAQGSQS